MGKSCHFFNGNQLSGLSGVTQATISNIENNLADFKYDTLNAITDALLIPLGLLVRIADLDILINDDSLSDEKKLEYMATRNTYVLLIKNERNRRLQEQAEKKEFNGKGEIMIVSAVADVHLNKFDSVEYSLNNLNDQFRGSEKMVAEAGDIHTMKSLLSPNAVSLISYSNV